MIQWPWQKWERVPPADPDTYRDSRKAVVEAEKRRWQTEEALRRRRVVQVHNHLAVDIRRALGHRG